MSRNSRTTPPQTSQRPAVGASRWRARAVTGALALLAVGGLYLAFRSGQPTAGTTATGAAGQQVRFQVGRPSSGQPAPAFELAASTGKPVSLADYRGKNVLLFFQEGIGCQPCWDQIRDLENDRSKLTAAGIDDVVSITTSPADLVAQKVRDDHLSTPVLADPDLTVSKAYHANSFGMMGDSRDGHSFLLIGKNGTVTWRADYGGAPNYTMYLPVDTILADLRTANAGTPATTPAP